MQEFTYSDLHALVYELPDEIEKYKQAGDFAAAQAAIDRWLLRPVGEELKIRLRLEREMLERLPGNYPYTAQQAVRLFREQVPDFDEKDLERLDESGLAEWIFIGKEKHYIHSAVRTCLSRDPELSRRSLSSAAGTGAAQGSAEAQAAVSRNVTEEMHRMKEEGGSCWRFRLRASIRLKDLFFTPGMFLKAHLPIPAELHQTSDVKILAHSGGRVSIDAPDSLYRAICFEDTLQENREFFVEYEYTVRLPYRDLSAALREGTAGDGTAKAVSARTDQDGNQMADFLGEQLPHIRFTPYLCALAQEITDGAQTALEKAWAIYEYITTKVSYAYMREYFLIPDIPQYCARNLRGDCGVQALLFITLCRICGIPAKWQSGLYFGGREEARPHDWAMFYTEPYGWLYADPSIGGGAYRSGEQERWAFYFGNVDPFRMTANHAFQQPFANPKRFLPDDPYDNQSGELESDRRGYIGREVQTEKVLLEGKRCPAK